MKTSHRRQEAGEEQHGKKKQKQKEVYNITLQTDGEGK